MWRLYIYKDFFLQYKEKKLRQINQEIHFLEFADLWMIGLKSGEFYL